MGRHIKSSDMTDEQRAAHLRHKKQVDYRRRIGIPDKCGTGETTKLVAHMRKLKYRYGMTPEQIGARADVHVTTVRDYIRGDHGAGRPAQSAYRKTYLALMAVEPEMPEGPGAMVPAAGTARRVMALQRAGYQLASLAELLDQPNYQRIWQYMHRCDTVRWTTLQKVATVYDKYVKLDPVEALGQAPRSTARARTIALKRGYAPWWCWDDETIDDPDAHPEWTGACGTHQGYRVHIRETFQGGTHMPPCMACREAYETRDFELVFRHDRFRELMAGRPGGIKRCAEAIGSFERSVNAWRLGELSPRYWSVVDALTVYLDCDLTDLVVLQEGEKVREVVEPGKFNRFVLRATLDLLRMSQSKAASLAGVGETSMTNYAAGRTVPSLDTIKNLAKHLGVKAEEFYA